jgi:hypothetical protein
VNTSLDNRWFCVVLLIVVYVEAPQSLKQLSRLAVRRSIRAQNLARYVPALPLPDSLKQYLVFSAERPGEDEAPVDDHVPAYPPLAASASEESGDEEDDEDNSSDDFE